MAAAMVTSVPSESHPPPGRRRGAAGEGAAEAPLPPFTPEASPSAKAARGSSAKEQGILLHLMNGLLVHIIQVESR